MGRSSVVSLLLALAGCRTTVPATELYEWRVATADVEASAAALVSSLPAVARALGGTPGTRPLLRIEQVNDRTANGQHDRQLTRLILTAAVAREGSFRIHVPFGVLTTDRLLEAEEASPDALLTAHIASRLEDEDGACHGYVHTLCVVQGPDRKVPASSETEFDRDQSLGGFVTVSPALFLGEALDEVVREVAAAHPVAVGGLLVEGRGLSQALDADSIRPLVRASLAAAGTTLDDANAEGPFLALVIFDERLELSPRPRFRLELEGRATKSRRAVIVALLVDAFGEVLAAGTRRLQR